MQQKMVSIIVPVYDAEKYLDRCVKSLRGQTWQRLEIILVDDGARDGSPGLCDDHGTMDARIRVLHKENGGLMSAWMAGVGISTGEYLCFVDSDDWVDACMVEEMMKEAAGVPGEIVCCNFLIERPGGSAECRHELPPGIYEGDALEEVRSRLLGNERRTVSMSRCMKLFSRELITENMKYCDPKIRMGEDVNIVLPALCDCSRLVILKDALYYHYFYNASSMVHLYDAGMWEGIRELIHTIRRIYGAKGTAGWERQWEKETLYLAMLAVKNELRGGRPGYADRTAEICGGDLVRKGLAAYPLQAEEKVNRILLWVMKRPDRIRCWVGKSLFALHDRIRM